MLLLTSEHRGPWPAFRHDSSTSTTTTTSRKHPKSNITLNQLLCAPYLIELYRTLCVSQSILLQRHRSRQTLLEADWSADSHDVLFDISASVAGLRCRCRITVNRSTVLLVENDCVCISPSDKEVMGLSLCWFDCQMINQEAVDKFSGRFGRRFVSNKD